MIAVTDTHALIWAATGKSRRLGRSARRYFALAEKRASNVVIYVPTIALVEIGEAVERNRISLKLPFGRWVESMFAAGPYIPADLTSDVVAVAHDLRAIPERRDRLIAASAIVLGCDLITRDPEIASVLRAQVKIVWD
ncbi:MAG: PIN domain-containing protein [Gemmatimonadaceae bacterium]